MAGLVTTKSGGATHTLASWGLGFLPSRRVYIPLCGGTRVFVDYLLCAKPWTSSHVILTLTVYFLSPRRANGGPEENETPTDCSKPMLLLHRSLNSVHSLIKH